MIARPRFASAHRPTVLHRPRRNLVLTLSLLTLLSLVLVLLLLRTVSFAAPPAAQPATTAQTAKGRASEREHREQDAQEEEEEEVKEITDPEFVVLADSKSSSARDKLPALPSVHDEDPFDKWIVGFPTKALSVDELKLCDEKQAIFLKDSWTCPNDATCKACRPEASRNRFRELQGAFREPSVQAARDRAIQLWFPAKGQTIVTFAFNLAHSDLFLNWACSVEKLGLDPREFTLVAPCDELVAKIVKALGFKHLDPAWLGGLSRKIRPQESFWGSDHADINNVALFLMHDVARLGYHAFVQDADVAWLKDPRPFLQHAIKRRDFIGMLAPFWTSMGPVNTGFLFVAPTKQMVIFLASMENAAEIKDTSDQRLWNTVQRHFVFQQLSWRLLPQEVIYKYSGRHAPKPGPDALVMHAVGSNKRRKLNDFGLWLLTPKCRFYNADSAKQSKEVPAAAA